MPANLHKLTSREREIVGRFAAQHGTVRGFDQTIADDSGAISWPLVRLPLLRRLADRGVLTAEQAGAGERFNQLFQRGQLDALKAADMSREPIAGGRRAGDLPPSAEHCRVRVAAAVASLGGHGSIAASVVWHVAGLEWSVSRWAQTTRRRQDQACGILIGALSALAAHFGGRR
jgi:hypothetical protein